MGTDQSRVSAGTPGGGRFAGIARVAANIEAADIPIEVPDAVGAAEEVPEKYRKDAEGRYLNPNMQLISLAGDDVSDLDEIGRVLPHLDDTQLITRWAEVVDARMKSERYADPVEAEEAPSGDQIIDLDEFGGWESDRHGEGESHGYDFGAYADSLSQAWSQRSMDAITDAIAANEAAAARPVQHRRVV